MDTMLICRSTASLGLSALYDGPADPRLDRDLDEALARAEAFARALSRHDQRARWAGGRVGGGGDGRARVDPRAGRQAGRLRRPAARRRLAAAGARRAGGADAGAAAARSATSSCSSISSGWRSTTRAAAVVIDVAGLCALSPPPRDAAPLPTAHAERAGGEAARGDRQHRPARLQPPVRRDAVGDDLRRSRSTARRRR